MTNDRSNAENVPRNRYVSHLVPSVQPTQAIDTEVDSGVVSDWQRNHVDRAKLFSRRRSVHAIQSSALNGPWYRTEVYSVITQPNISVEDLLQQLIADETRPTQQELVIFSDLTRMDLQRVRQRWVEIPVDRRLYVVRTLVEQSRENLQLHLGRLLRLALTDEHSEVRRIAVEGLWEEVSEDLVGPFVQMLYNDPDEEVRAATAAALGAYVLAGELDELDASLSIRAEEALLTVLHSETEPLAVQRRALESIAFSGEVGVRQIIEDAYYSPYEEMRLSALVAMGRSADVRWRGVVRSELESPSAAMRAEAARACGELEARSALDELLLLLMDEEAEVRLAAIFALGRLGGKEAEEALEAVAEGSNDPDEVEAAEEALDEAIFYGDHEAIPLFDEPEEDEDEGFDFDNW